MSILWVFTHSLYQNRFSKFLQQMLLIKLNSQEHCTAVVTFSLLIWSFLVQQTFKLAKKEIVVDLGNRIHLFSFPQQNLYSRGKQYFDILKFCRLCQQTFQVSLIMLSCFPDMADKMRKLAIFFRTTAYENNLSKEVKLSVGWVMDP